MVHRVQRLFLDDGNYRAADGERIAMALHGTTEVVLGDKTVSYKAPFKRISIFDAIKENTGIDISDKDEAGLREVYVNN